MQVMRLMREGAGRWRAVYTVASLILCVGSASAQTDPGPVDISNRESARSWFNTWWPLSHNAAMGFTGDVATGKAGDTSQAFKDNVALRINIFRRMEGLQPVVLNNPTYNSEDQIMAMMMSANGGTNHNPPTTWKFYSSDGADAAMHSLLAYGVSGPSAIVGYMFDPGPENIAAGHRNLGIIFPSQTIMGTGDVPESGTLYSANALWAGASGDQSANQSLGLLPWPAKGYVPNFLIPGRWTLNVPDATSTSPCNLSQATATVTKDGVNLPIKTTQSPAGGTLVWTLDGTIEGDSDTLVQSFNYQGETFADARPNFENDIVYHVAIDGIRIPHFDNDGGELGDGPLYTGNGVVAGHFEYYVIGYNPDFGIAVSGQQANLINISTRSFAGGGSSTQIAGFIINGTSPRKVLIRAGGPYLSQFGVNNALADPLLTLHNGSNGQELGNDDWGSDAVNIVAATTKVGATPFTPGSKDAAIVATLQPGVGYTALVSGKSGATGNAIVEVYDADDATDSRLINISTRSFVGAGASIQIGGFILRGQGPRKVLIRAGGPYLTQFSVSSVLADPVLTVFAGKTQIATNDDWQSNSVDVIAATRAANVTAYSVGSKDSALVLTLDPDKAYTAQVSGKNGGTGNALIEIFALP